MKIKFIIDDMERSLKENNAGYKARNDTNHFLKKNGFQTEYLLKGSSKLLRLFHYLKLAKKVKREACLVVFQYPYRINTMYKKMMKYWMPKNSVLLIHDIDSLRDQMNGVEIAKEIKLFNQFENVISHNSKMTLWLKRNGCKSKIVDLEIFDYSIETFTSKQICKQNNIAFAGNLSSQKSGFLYSDDLQGLFINVYGSNFEDRNLNNLSYKGSYPADKLPNLLTEKFGLIWDGESPNSCIGAFGDYLKYNNPHKTSLYLVSRIPVIVWDESAIADFVKKYNVGLCVSSLKNLNRILNDLTEEEYKKMHSNVLIVAKEIENGNFLKKALEKCGEGDGNV